MTQRVSPAATTIDEADDEAQRRLASLKAQAEDRVTALAEKKKERDELMAAAEIARSWPTIEGQVKDAKEADRLAILGKAIPMLSRGVTSLAKTASDQLINQNFETLFQEECDAFEPPNSR